MKQSIHLVNVRWQVALFVVGLLFISTTTAFAQEEPVDEPAESELTTQVYMPLVSVSNVQQDATLEKLEGFVEAALANEITVEEADEFFFNLTDEEKEQVIALTEEQLQPPSNESGDGQESPSPGGSGVGIQAIPPDVVWRQDIEYSSRSDGRPADYYNRDRFECDGSQQSGDEDYDYIFFYPNYNGAQNPDGIRYTVTSASVRAALGWGSKKLTGFGFSYNEVRICVGPWRVQGSGGGAHWRNNLGVLNP